MPFLASLAAAVVCGAAGAARQDRVAPNAAYVRAKQRPAETGGDLGTIQVPGGRAAPDR